MEKPVEKPVLIIGKKCSLCGLFITQPYMVDSEKARSKMMEEEFRDHVVEKHADEDR